MQGTSSQPTVMVNNVVLSMRIFSGGADGAVKKHSESVTVYKGHTIVPLL